MRSCCAAQEPSLALCDELEGQDGGWERGERGGDVCIMADLCCHMAEANTTLYTFFKKIV